jgi:hypothetical protein
MNAEINDIRSSAEFSGISFSKFQKSKVKLELLNSLITSKVEPACYWCAELICAGHFSDVWEMIILFICRYIHLGNPKLPIYLSMRFSAFKEVMNNGYGGNELSLRNNMKIRKLFAEIVCVLCHSRKKHNFEPVKIKKEEEFSMTHMSSKLKAPSINYATALFRKDDPKEMYIAINEFAYHISEESHNVVSACYWLEWVLEFDAVCKGNKERCICENRHFVSVQDKFKNDSIWIIWEVILTQCSTKDNPLVTKIVNALLEIFCIKYSSGVKKRRRFVIYFAIALLTEPVDFKIEMINNKKEIDAVVNKIGMIYKDVKKNEMAPSTDYLFNNINAGERSNLDKTIERLETMYGSTA